MNNGKVADISGINIKRVEPLSWWVGMKTPLQLMIYGENISGCEITVIEKGVKIERVHNAESPNYIFADISIDPRTEPGEYTFELKNGSRSISFKYLIGRRREGSSERKSYSTEDLVYLIKTDRFSNGDPAITTTPITKEGASRKNFSARHGGDLQGIINHLDYIEEVGATALWITPPQLDNEEEFSYHGYAIADYYHIDPRFGNNEKYRSLVLEAHKRGLKVIMDAVPNHCGKNHWWIKDLPFQDWIHPFPEFTRSNYRLTTINDYNASQYDKKLTVEGWFDNIMPDLAIENPFLLQYFKQVYIWWIEWADLDGLRVDTFPYNEKHAAAEWIKGILQEYPNLNIVAECWHVSPPIVAYWQTGAANKDGYDSNLPTVMDFPLQKAIHKGIALDSTEWYEGMNLIYEALALDFVYPNPYNLLIFLDNHDIPRFADDMDGDKDRVKMGITLLATLRGIPQLYYGTELMFRSADPEKGDGAARIDFPGGWPGDKRNLFKSGDRNKEEAEVFEHTKKLFNWRKTASVIHYGKTVHFLPEENTYAYFRYDGINLVFVFINASSKTKSVKWDKFKEITDEFSVGINILDEEKIKIGQQLKVKGRNSIVVEFNKKK